MQAHRTTESGELECPRAREWARAAFSDDVVYLLNLAAQQARGAAADGLAELGLSPRNYAILTILALRQPLRQHEIGALLGIDRTSMVSLIDGLEKMGLAVRTCDPVDRRAYALRLTDAGRAAAVAARAAMNGAQDVVLANLNESDRNKFKLLLAELLRPAGTPTQTERNK